MQFNCRNWYIKSKIISRVCRFHVILIVFKLKLNEQSIILPPLWLQDPTVFPVLVQNYCVIFHRFWKTFFQGEACILLLQKIRKLSLSSAKSLRQISFTHFLFKSFGRTYDTLLSTNIWILGHYFWVSTHTGGISQLKRPFAVLKKFWTIKRVL